MLGRVAAAGMRRRIERHGSTVHRSQLHHLHLYIVQSVFRFHDIYVGKQRFVDRLQFPLGSPRSGNRQQPVPLGPEQRVGQLERNAAAVITAQGGRMIASIVTRVDGLTSTMNKPKNPMAISLCIATDLTFLEI